MKLYCLSLLLYPWIQSYATESTESELKSFTNKLIKEYSKLPHPNTPINRKKHYLATLYASASVLYVLEDYITLLNQTENSYNGIGHKLLSITQEISKESNTNPARLSSELATQSRSFPRDPSNKNLIDYSQELLKYWTDAYTIAKKELTSLESLEFTLPSLNKFSQHKIFQCFHPLITRAEIPLQHPSTGCICNCTLL